MAMAEFQDKLARLQKALTATTQTAAEARARLDAIKRAVDATPSLPVKRSVCSVGWARLRWR